MMGAIKNMLNEYAEKSINSLLDKLHKELSNA